MSSEDVERLDANFNRIVEREHRGSNAASNEDGDGDGDLAYFRQQGLAVPHAHDEQRSLSNVSGGGDTRHQINLFADGGLWQATWEGSLDALRRFAEEPFGSSPGATRGEFERGAEGETILHLAVLRKHADLVRWIVGRFPSLVNETYLRHRYYGETALHVAVVNAGTDHDKDDISLVKLLVENGALINEPFVSGTEFLKDEDKGILYYGQTILQFAAANGKFEAVKYLVENGADVTLVDLYGNNVLHVMAYHGNFDMKLFNYLKKRNEIDIRNASRSNGKIPIPVDISKARNKEHLTAYQLGISRGHVKALEAMKDIIWEFGMVRQYRICLDDLDPLQPHTDKAESFAEKLKDGNKSLERFSKSAIEIAVENGDKEILSHPLMESLLKIKWALYGRSRFLWRMALTFFLVICVTFTIALQPNSLDDRRNYSISDENRHPILRGVFELSSVIGTIILVSAEFAELRVQGGGYFRGYGAAENTVQWMFAVFIWLIPVLRWGLAAILGHDKYEIVANAENVVFGFGAIWGWFYILEFAKGFETLGPLLLIFRRMMFEDFFAWMTLYSVLTVGFACGLFLQMQNVPFESANGAAPVYDWNNFAGALLWTIRFIFVAQEEFEDFREARIPAFTEFLYMLYAFVTVLVLFNVLIAMLAETLVSIASDAKRVWRIQFASLLIQMDESMSDRTHKHILTHLGWTQEEADREQELDPTTTASEKTAAPKKKQNKFTASRYFVFTERDTVTIDPITKKKRTKTETVKLVVAKDIHGKDIEIRTDRNHWHGWSRDLLRVLWTGGEEKLDAGWWKKHPIRQTHDVNRSTLYQKINRVMRKRVGDNLGLKEHEHVDTHYS
ncbi:hypothetical protein BDR26DRAFT_918303 [Obelidium mucronatum]|nr:hypothetical protein BDR26DRAFT_918303 [Obelidium mucronatum]